MKSLKSILSVLVVVIFTFSCSPISDEDVAPDVKKEKFEVEKTKGGPGPEGGGPGND